MECDVLKQILKTLQRQNELLEQIAEDCTEFRKMELIKERNKFQSEMIRSIFGS